jgi:hypothetical protein
MARIDDYGNGISLPAEGTFEARLSSLIDVGLQPTKFGLSRQAKLAFELSGPTADAEKPVLAFKTIWNLSPRSDGFREIAKALTNRAELKGLDLRDLVGAPCMIEIVHVETDNGVYANVEVSRYKGVKKLPALVSDPVFFSLHPSDFDPDVLEGLHAKLKEKIKSSSTYKDLLAERELAKLETKDIIGESAPFDDDIPPF